MAFYKFLADLVVVIHALWVAMVVFGLLAILLGWALGWSWVRNFWFRAAHLFMIAIVAAEAVFGIVCPLTSLEKNLREKSGQGDYAGDFIGYWVHRLLFWESVPPWGFTILYIGFALMVAVVFWAVPPRWPKRCGRLAPRARPLTE